MTRLSQKKYIELWLQERSPDRYVPIYDFIGDKKIVSLDRWVLFSHRAPARVTELFYDGKLDRRMVKGKSSYYYEYCLRSNANN